MNQDALAPYYRDVGRLNLLPGWARPAPACIRVARQTFRDPPDR